MLEDLPELEVAVDGQLEKELHLEPVPESLRVRFRGIEEEGELPVQLPFDGVFEKLHHLVLLGRRQQIRLRQQEDDPRGVLRQLADELQVVFRQGPVGAHRQDGGAHLGKPVGRYLHVGLEDAPQARGIHEAQPRVIGKGRQFDIDHLHVLLIRGVLRLGSVLVEFRNRNLFAGAVEKGDGGPLLFTELQAADDRRDGDDADGQDVLPDEAVDKGALAGLELAENGHVDGGILDEKALAGLDLTAQGQDLHPVAGRPDLLQALLREMLDMGATTSVLRPVP